VPSLSAHRGEAPGRHGLTRERASSCVVSWGRFRACPGGHRPAARSSEPNLRHCNGIGHTSPRYRGRSAWPGRTWCASLWSDPASCCVSSAAAGPCDAAARGPPVSGGCLAGARSRRGCEAPLVPLGSRCATCTQGFTSNERPTTPDAGPHGIRITISYAVTSSVARQRVVWPRGPGWPPRRAPWH